MVGRTAADRLADEVAGDVVAVFLQVGLIGSDADGLFVGQFLVHLMQQHFAGVLLAQTGQRFQTLQLLGTQGIDLCQTCFRFFRALLQVFFLALQRFGLAVQCGLFLIDAVLLTADLRPALLDLLVGLRLLGIDLRLQPEGFVLGFQNRFLALLVCGLDRFIHQAGRFRLGAADLCFCSLFPIVVTNKIARSSADNSHDQCHNPSDCGHRVFTLL